MPYTNEKSEDKSAVKIHFEDLGSGQPVILIHGWPASKDMWEYQYEDILAAGFRVIGYDRRGFGKSDKPAEGYNYDIFAEDLHQLIHELNLENVILVGFSMGGGEVARYIGKYGTSKLAKAVLISSVVPLLKQTPSNSDGVPEDVLQGMIKEIKKDRPGFLTEFSKNFFGVTTFSNPVSEGILNWMAYLAFPASNIATTNCIEAFGNTDFNGDLSSFNIPTLIIHGDADKIVPIDATGRKAAQSINGSIFKVYEGAPHGLFVTEKEQLNLDLINFFKQ